MVSGNPESKEKRNKKSLIKSQAPSECIQEKSIAALPVSQCPSLESRYSTFGAGKKICM
jgi:hypothetical protein